MNSIRNKHFHVMINFCFILIILSNGYTKNSDLQEIEKTVEKDVEDLIGTYVHTINSGSHKKFLVLSMNTIILLF